MLDKDLIRKKLSALHKYLKELEPLTQLTLAEYRADFIRRHAVEKVLELVVEYALDINRAVISAAQAEPPQTGYNTFLEMERLGIIPPELTPRLAAATGLRNRLVHHYNEIDNKAVYHSLQPFLRHYREYARLIRSYLDRREGKRATKRR